MAQKKWYKIISLISAIAMIFGMFSCLTLSVNAETDTFDFQSYVDSANLYLTNDNTEDDLDNALAAINLPAGYTYKGISEYYRVDAFDGAVERGSLYNDAPDEEILVEGEKGAIGALISLGTPTGNITATIAIDVQPKMEVFSFASISNTMEDWVGDNINGYSYTGGWVDKLVIPDEIGGLASDWHSWQGNFCVVYGKGLKNIGRCCYQHSQVAVFKGEVEGIWNLAFYEAANLRCISIPKTCTYIGEQSFLNCTKIKQMRLPEGLKHFGPDVFWSLDHSDARFNLTELIIPESVNDMYQSVLGGAAQKCTVTVLTTCDAFGWGIFYDGDEEHKQYYENLYIRAYPGSVAYNYCYTVNDKISIHDGVSLTEAVARASLNVDSLKKTFYPSSDAIMEQSDVILANFAKAYFNSQGIVGSWKNAEWDYVNDNWVNYVVLTKGKKSAEMKVELPASLDLTPFLANVKVDNNTDKDSFEAAVNAAMPAGIEATVTEFAKIDAMPGVVERGSTYPGAVDGTILVPGEKGYIAATVEAMSGGSVISNRINLTIEPEMVEKAYSSVSTDLQWSVDANGVGTYKGGNSYEKVIIPDNVKTLPSQWAEWNGGIKCLVVGSGLTYLPRAVGMGSLEVVSFKETTEFKTLSNLCFMNASKLKYIRMPDSVTSIGGEAFRGCTALEYFYISNNMDSIAENAFIKPTEDNYGHNLKTLTIPASVTYIGGNAFGHANALKNVYVLSKSNNLWNSNAFYNAEDGYGKDITLYAWKDGRDGHADKTYNAPTKLYLDDLNTSELLVRAHQAVDKIGASASFDTVQAVEAVADDYLEAIENSYFGLGKITAAWGSEWTTDGGFLFNNDVVLTIDGKDTVVFPFAAAKSTEFNLQAILDKAGFKADNDTTEASLVESIKANGLANYDVSLIDFYNLHAFDGAIERGSTYEDAPTEDVVLVPGETGYMSAIVSIKGTNGAEIVSTLKYKIDPKMAIYSFSSVTTEDDFEVDANGKLTDYWGSAEKVVIPDFVTSLYQDWNAWDNTVKCYVFGTGLKNTIRNLSNGALEVVSFKGNNITSIGGLTFYEAPNLKYIRLPESLLSLGAEAFRFNTAMTQLYLPEGLVDIYENIFYKSSDTGFHNVTQFTIPSTANYIANEAFCGAGKECEVTILTKSHNLWNSGVFYSAAYPDRGRNYTLRVWHDANQASADQMYASAKVKKYLENIGVCEAYVRALKAADDMKGTSYESDDITKLKFSKAYFGSGAITGNLEFNTWQTEGTNVTNNYIVKKGDYSFSVPVVLAGKSGFYSTAASILNSVDFEANGFKQTMTFGFNFTSSAAGKIEVDGNEYDVVEYGVITKHIADATVGSEPIADDAFVLGGNGITALKGNTVSYAADAKLNNFNVAIENIPQGGRDYVFQARGYVKYNDGGSTKTIYTDSQYSSAKAAYNIVCIDAAYMTMAEWFNAAIN